MKQFVIIVVSIALSTFLLWFVLQGVDTRQLIASIQQANWGWISLSIIFTILSIATRGIRWRGLLNRRISIGTAIHLLGVTSMLNQLPLRAGEVARSIIVTRYEIPILSSAASIVIERLFDVFVVVIVVLLVVFQIPDVPSTVVQGATIFAILATIGFASLLFFAHFPSIPRSILSWLMKRIPFLDRFRLTQLLDNLLDGLQPLVDWRMFIHAVVWTGVAWAMSFISIYATARAVGVVDKAWLLALLGGSLASLSIAIPVTIASIGLIEGAFTLAGQMLAVDSIAYTAIGFSYHGILIVVYMLMGFLGFFVLGISLRDIVGNSANYPD